jgi:chaperone required for assembly of F1-ATPase
LLDLTKWSGIKRFYEKTNVGEKTDGEYLIFLDKRTVRTPAGADLLAPTRSLAEAMAAEWDAQGDIIDPGRMPLCKLSATAIDRIKKNRSDVIGITLKIAETDLLCYRAKEPADLVDLQNSIWQSELNWSKKTLCVDLAVTDGILPIIQPEDSLKVLQDILLGLDEYRLMGVTNAAAATGSLILSLALFLKRLDAKEIFEISMMEEIQQMKKWGEDEEVLKRHEIIRLDLQNSQIFLELLEK